MRSWIVFLGMFAFAFTSRAAPADPTPPLPDLIDLSVARADNAYAGVGQCGLAGVVSAEDQAWADQQVGQWQGKLDRYYASLKATHQPAERYNAMDIADTADDAPARVEAKLIRDRPSIKQAMGDGAYRVAVSLPALIITPDLIDNWLSTAKVDAKIAAAVKKVATEEVGKLVAVAGKMAGAKDNSALAAYVRQQAVARQAIWESIARELTPDQRRSFGAAIQSDDMRSQLSQSVILVSLRDERRWAPTGVPAAALADSDQASSIAVPADGRYTLIQADSRQLVCTVDLKKGEFVGFTLGMMGIGSESVAAMAGDRTFPIKPAEHVYYWVHATADTPLTVTTLSVTPAEGQPANPR